MDGYFCLELGRRSAPAYGPGFIVFKSTRTEPNKVHRYLYELVQKAFNRLKDEMDRLERSGNVGGGGRSSGKRTGGGDDADNSYDDFDDIDDESDDEPQRIRQPPPQIHQPAQLTYTNAYVDRPITYQQQQQQQPYTSNRNTSSSSYQPQTEYLNVIDEEIRTDPMNQNEVHWRKQTTSKTTKSPPPPSQTANSSSYQTAAPIPINRVNDPYESNARSPQPPNNGQSGYQKTSGHRKTTRDDYNQYMEDPNDMKVYRLI